MTFTTSYKSKGMPELLTALVRGVRGRKVIEFGTQQGNSAIALAKGVEKGGEVDTFDYFEKKYSKKPFKKTHADFDKAQLNTFQYKEIIIWQINVNDLEPVHCDVLHIDICNHKGNVKPLVKKWHKYVRKMIILEGGIKNHWQKKYGFKPYKPKLKEWRHIVIKGDDGYAMTIMTRR